MKFADCPVTYMPKGLSYHSLLVLRLGGLVQSSGRSFRFLNYMTGHPDFSTVVREAWIQQDNRGILRGFWKCFKSVEIALNSLHSKDFNVVCDKIESKRARLEEVQKMLVENGDDLNLLRMENEIRTRLRKWLRVEEIALA